MTSSRGSIRGVRPPARVPSSAFGYIKDGQFIAGSISDSDQSDSPSASSPGSDKTQHPSDPRDLIHMGPWKNADLVRPGLYLGNIQIVTQTRYLTEHRVTHIVSVCHEEIPAQRRDSPIAHFRIPIDDADNADLLIWLPSACLFIQTALAGDGVVLVHSTLGQSRSAAVVAAYLMVTEGVAASEAQQRVRAAREQIWIRPGFVEQLVLFGICGHQPHPGHTVYRNWRAHMDHASTAS